jgi:hypothetical protein
MEGLDKLCLAQSEWNLSPRFPGGTVNFNSFMIRAVCLLIILGALGFYLEREQTSGRFQQADEAFLDFLVANSRDRFVPEKGKMSDEVVFVRLREEDKDEYATWPPAPIDWQILLKGLVPFEPDVIVIPTILHWGTPEPEFVPQVGEALLPFPSVVLGVEGRESTGATAPTDLGLLNAFPALTRIGGEPERVPNQALVAAPSVNLRGQTELGFVQGPLGLEGASIPLVVMCNEKRVPSCVLQALSRYTRTPYGQQRLRLGAGAGAYLGKGGYVPLKADGSLVVDGESRVASINALDLMTGQLADALSPEDRAKLGKGKIVVIGIDTDQPAPTVARLQVQALGQILSLPRIQTLGDVARWSICGVAALLGLFLLRFRGGRALRTGLLLIFVVLVVSFVLFQSQLIWYAPSVPGAILAASGLFAMLFGKRPVTPQTADVP